MSRVAAISVSAAVLRTVMGETREGVGLGHGHILLGRHVITLVPVGGARMPNGIECHARVERGERVVVGGGRVGPVVLARSTELWDAVPTPRVVLRTAARVAIDVEHLAGRGPGLTPAGDDLLAGYVAGLVLFHRRRGVAEGIAMRAAARTTALSATLLGHAARGELPGPAHAFLERGEVGPLLSWGRSSGRHLALGLALAFTDPRASRLAPAGKEVHAARLAA